MTQLAPSASAIAAPAAAAPAHSSDERLPMGQSVLLIVVLSLGLWTTIGLAVRWAIA